MAGTTKREQTTWVDESRDEILQLAKDFSLEISAKGHQLFSSPNIFATTRVIMTK